MHDFFQKVAIPSVLTALAVPGAAHTTEIQKIVPADLSAGDIFGQSCAISGTTVCVGAPYADVIASNAGAVYVFTESAGVWVQQAKFTASTAAAGDSLGMFIDIDGDTMAVGAPLDDDNGADSGSVFIFTRTGTVWSEQAIVTPTGGAAGDHFGDTLALIGDTLIVGAHLDDDNGADSGSAFVFTRSGTTWTQEAQLSSSDAAAGDYFGDSVSLDVDLAIVGAPGNDDAGADSGSAYIFSRSGTVWTQDLKQTAHDAAAGDQFGASVAITIHGTALRAAVGSPHDDDKGLDSGTGYAYRNYGTGWTFENKHYAPGGKPGEDFGRTCFVQDHFFCFGSPLGDPGPAPGVPNAGRAHTFEGPPENLDKAALTALDLEAGAELATSLDMSGDWIVVGAPKDGDRGAAYVFWRVWPPVNYCTAGTSASGCQAQITASGYPSVNEPYGFSLIAFSVEGGKDGLFFYGTNGRQLTSWGSGTSYKCVVPPVMRAGLMVGSGSPGNCDGTFVQDLNALWCPTCPKPQKSPGAGAIVQAQLWFRDPFNTSNQTTSLSNAVEFGVNP